MKHDDKLSGLRSLEEMKRRFGRDQTIASEALIIGLAPPILFPLADLLRDEFVERRS